MASHTNLVVRARLETACFLRDLSEEPQPFLLGRRLVFDHGGELGNFGGEDVHGRGEDGVEFAEVGEVAGEVEGEGVECMGVFGEDGKGVRVACGGGRVGSAGSGHHGRC